MKVSGNAWSISTPTPLSNLQIAYPLEQNRHKVAQLVLRNLLLDFNNYDMLTAVVPFAKRSGQPAHSATVRSVTATVRSVTATVRSVTATVRCVTATVRSVTVTVRPVTL